MISLTSALKKDKTNIIICNQKNNEKLFNEAIKEPYLYDLKFKSFIELEREVLGYFTDEALFLAQKTKNITFEAAKDYLKSLLVLNSDDKQTYQDYYKFDMSYIEFYKEKNVIVYLSSSYDNYVYKALNILKESGVSLTYLSFDEVENPSHYLKEYSNNIREIEGLSDDIMSLLDNKVSIDNIKVELLDDSYYSLVEDVFSFYKIPYFFDKVIPLSSYEDIVKFVNYLENKNAQVDINSYNDYIEENAINGEIKAEIEYIISTNEIPSLEYFKYLLRNLSLKNKKYKNAIEIGKFFGNLINDDEYLFIVGANQKSFPKPFKMPGLYSELTLLNSGIKDEKFFNNFLESYYIQNISSIKNLTISYKKMDFSKTYSRAVILDNVHSFKFMVPSFNNVRYSFERDKIKYLKALDIFSNYSNITNDYESFDQEKDSFLKDRILYNQVVDLNDIDIFKKYLDKKLTLSDTSIEKYYDCPYKYYLSALYKLDKFESTYSTYLGNFFHLFISIYLNKPYDQTGVDILYDQFREDYKKQNNYELSISEAYYFERFYSSLERIHKAIMTRLEGAFYTKEYREKRFTYTKDVDGTNVTLKGFADLIFADDEKDVVIIDYKTGEVPSIKVDDGKGLQLFIYFILYNLENEGNAKLTGVFYEKISKLPKSIDEDDKLVEIKGRRLDSASTSNFFNNSSFSLPRNRLSQDDLNMYVEVTKNKIEEATTSILENKFKATPSTSACMYCKFSEICYMANEKEYKDEEADTDDTN